MIDMKYDKFVSVYKGSENSKTVKSTEIRVGDVYRFNEGMQIPADSVLL
jgi:magnesium-transporting ATPase (P-type)